MNIQLCSVWKYTCLRVTGHRELVSWHLVYKECLTLWSRVSIFLVSMMARHVGCHGSGLNWLGHSCLSYLKEKARRCGEASLLLVVGTGEQCSSPCKRAAWCLPGPYPPLSLQGRATLLMKCSVLVSTGPSWPLHHLLVSAWGFGEHNAGWLSFLAASVCFCNYFIALNSHLWDVEMMMYQTQSEEFKILRREEMDPGRLDGL